MHSGAPRRFCHVRQRRQRLDCGQNETEARSYRGSVEGNTGCRAAFCCFVRPRGASFGVGRTFLSDINHPQYAALICCFLPTGARLAEQQAGTSSQRGLHLRFPLRFEQRLDSLHVSCPQCLRLNMPACCALNSAEAGTRRPVFDGAQRRLRRLPIMHRNHRR